MEHHEHCPSPPSPPVPSLSSAKAFPDSILAEEVDPVVKEVLERSAAAEAAAADKGEARDQKASLVG